MLSLVGIAVAAALLVAYAVPRHAGFGRHIVTGIITGAVGLTLILLLTIAIETGTLAIRGLGRGLLISAALGGILGATGASAVWVAGRVDRISGLFRARPGFDPEGEAMGQEAAEARRRSLIRQARAQVEAELARGHWDADLWQQAGDELGSGSERRRRRYVELRAERIVLG